MATFFTIGCAHRTPQYLLKLLRSRSIDCVVDIRSSPNISSKTEFTSEKLKTFLQKNAITYLPFTVEFGLYPPSCFDATNDLLRYEEAVRTVSFQRGIERLKTGLEKGYTIALLGEPINPTECHRYSIIGRYLQKQGITALHIMKDGTLRNQISLEIEQRQAPPPPKRMTEAQAKHNELGKWGEDIAAAYLEEHGFSIIERNWRNRHREIDIIALNQKTQVFSFVEVKTRRSNDFGEPELAVTRKKMWLLTLAANNYIRYHDFVKRAQFDIIAITGTPETGYKINYIPDAIPPSARTTYR